MSDEFSPAFSSAFDAAAAPGGGRCDAWPITWPCDIASVSQQTQDDAHALAAQLLWALSGYRFGVCTYNEAYRMPCSGSCPSPYKDSQGNWRNGGFADCCRILLRHAPVVSITSVTEEGVVLDPSAYGIEGSWLRRRFACWPCIGSCDDPAIVVSYRAGVPLAEGVGLAVGEVACEFIAAIDGKPCKLPSRAVNITRQGVSVQLAADDEFVANGRLGLPIADAWLRIVNPQALRMRSRVYSPDLASATAVR